MYRQSGRQTGRVTTSSVLEDPAKVIRGLFYNLNATSVFLS